MRGIENTIGEYSLTLEEAIERHETAAQNLLDIAKDLWAQGDDDGAVDYTIRAARHEGEASALRKVVHIIQREDA